MHQISLDYTTAADTIPEPNPHSNENAEYSNSDIEIVMAGKNYQNLVRQFSVCII